MFGFLHLINISVTIRLRFLLVHVSANVSSDTINILRPFTGLYSSIFSQILSMLVKYLIKALKSYNTLIAL